MSAPEVRAKVEAISSELKVSHTLAIGYLHRIYAATAQLAAIESRSPDAAIALASLKKSAQETEESINTLMGAIEYVDNFRWSL